MRNQLLAEILLQRYVAKESRQAIREAAEGKPARLLALIDSDMPWSRRDRKYLAKCLAKYLAGGFKRKRGRPPLNTARPRTERDKIAQANKKAADVARELKGIPELRAGVTRRDF